MMKDMWDYLIALLDDANDFSWTVAKASHAVNLCRIQQGKINNYSKVEQIDRVRWLIHREKVTQTHRCPEKYSYKEHNVYAIPLL